MLKFNSKEWQAAWNGLFHRCPQCEKPSIYQSYLKVHAHCTHCGLELDVYPSDDMPPYISMSLVSTLIVPIALILGYKYDISDFLQFLIWVPITIALILLSLPPIKGATIGVLWALDIKRDKT